MSRRVLRAGAIYTAANALAAGIPFLLLPVLTRALAPADYGLVIDFFLLATLCSALAGMAVHAAVPVKWFDRAGRDFPRLVGNAVLLAVASTALCGALMAIASTAFKSTLHLPSGLWIGAAVYSGCNVVLGIRTGLWQSQERPLSVAALQISGAGLNVGLSLVGVFVLRWGGEGRTLGALAAAAVMAAVAVAIFVLQGQVTWRLDRGYLRELGRFGIGLAPHTLAGAILATIDRLAVSTILGREQLGIYGTAAQLGMAMSVVGDAVIKAFSPWMYKQMAQRSARGRLRLVGAGYASVPLWIVTSVLLWSLLLGAGPFLLGDRYRPALLLSLWFFLGGAISTIYLSVAGLFFFSFKNEWLSTATMTTAAAAAVLAPALTKAFGLAGAAASYVAAQALLLTLAWLLSTRVQPMPWNRPRLALRVLLRGARAR